MESLPGFTADGTLTPSGARALFTPAVLNVVCVVSRPARMASPTNGRDMALSSLAIAFPPLIMPGVMRTPASFRRWTAGSITGLITSATASTAFPPAQLRTAPAPASMPTPTRSRLSVSAAP